MISSRRRALLSVVNLEKYKELLFNYVFYNLISDSDLKDKGKTKLAEIQGNGVIENQLVNYVYATNTESDITFTNNNDGSITVSGTASAAIADKAVARALNSYLIANHYYLRIIPYISGTITSRVASASANTDIWKQTSDSPTDRNIYVSIPNGTSFATPYTFFPQLIDLTLMFGTGNEPTTLTDNRIQALLNRGYIPYNAGTYKASRVGEIELEPYNLLSLDRTQGTGGDWDNTTQRVFEEGKFYPGMTINNYCSPSQISNLTVSGNSVSFQTGSAAYGVGFPVRVVGGKNYKLEYESTEAGASGTRYYSWYDKKGNNIGFGSDSGSGSKTAPQNAYWCLVVLRPSTSTDLVTYSNVCLHLEGTRTGYAPHIAPTKIQLPAIYEGNGAINSHDTYAITPQNHVFTRNVWKVDLGTLSFSYTNSIFVCDVGNIKTQTNDVVANAICKRFTTVSRNDFVNNSPDKTMRVDNSQNTPYMYFRDSSYSSSSDFKDSLNNVYLHYELVTPQVINIPRKHLGVVDLGSLSWTKSSNHFYATMPNDTKKPSGNNIQANIFCSNHISTIANNVNSEITDKGIAVSSGGSVVIYDSSKSTLSNTDFKSAMSGIYLFYETQYEVADFTNKAIFENGGTITSNWFSWVENQLVSNGNFENGTNGWYCSNGTLTSNNKVLTITKTSSSAFNLYRANVEYNIDYTHKYLLVSIVKASSNCKLRLRTMNAYGDKVSVSANTKTSLVSILSPTSSSSFAFALLDDETFLQANDTLEVYYLEMVDLTLGFGAGNEPTSIDDPRMQQIIALGYIPTDTSGTQANVQNDVLANVKMKMQEK